MRAIDATLKARIELAQQTLYNNANPQMDVTVTRPRTPITRAGFWQESIVTAGATSVCTSVCVRRSIKNPTRAYVAYVTDGGSLVVKYADLNVAFDNLNWITIETIADCAACALEFDGSFVSAPRGRVEFLTDETPWLFYVTAAGALMGGLLGGAYETLAAANVTALDAIRGVASWDNTENQGLLLFYIVSGVLYYKQRIADVWGGQTSISLAPANAVKVKAERVFDWKIVLQVTDNTGALTEIFSKMEASGWNSTEHISLSDISTQMARIPITYASYQAAAEHFDFDALAATVRYATYSPTVRSAENIATTIEDPENPGQFIEDYGYRIVFGFDQWIPNAATYPALFKLEGAYGAVWYGQSAVVDGLFVTVTFNDFNNAGETPTVRVLAGGLSNGYVAVTESSKAFTAVNLVPTFVPAPVVTAIENLDATTIVITFDLDIEDIASQSGFAVTGHEPAYSPDGALVDKTYVVDSVGYADPYAAGADVDFSSGTLTNMEVV